MLIHSIMAHDVIFPAEPVQSCCMQLDNRWLEGTVTAEGLKLSRLISTDPADYLQAQWQPGQCIDRRQGKYK